MPDQLTQWSYSRWQTYTQCPFKAKCAYIDKLPQPDSPALAKGNMVHAAAEDYINKKRKDVIPELKQFSVELKGFRKKPPFVELQWAFTNKWEPTGWFDKDCWCRVKTDIMWANEKAREGFIVDWKTGKQYPEHKDQLGLYALGGFIIIPELLRIRAADWYCDTGVKVPEDFIAGEAKPLKQLWNKRVEPMLHDEKFVPKPNRFCGWCPFRKAVGGPCSFGG